MSAEQEERQTVSVSQRDRLMDLEAHREWCEAWLARQDVKHPQITQEWVNLLEEVAWAVEEIESLRIVGVCPECGGPADDHYFDRSPCPCGDGIGTMHTCCRSCGYPLDGCEHEPQERRTSRDTKERSED